MALPNLSPSDFVAALTVGARKDFADAYAAILAANPYEWMGLVKESASTHSSETHIFEKEGPKVRDITEDAMTYEGYADDDLVLTNREYGSFAVIKKAILDDDMNTNRFIADKMANMAMDHVANMEDVFSTLLTSTTEVSADGETFYSNGHASGDNLGNLAVTTADIATSVTNIQTAFTAMFGFTNGAGRYLKVRPNVIVVGNGDTARAWEQIIDSPLLPGSTNNDANPFSSYNLTLVKLPQITSATAWYAFDTRHPYIKPFIYQNRQAPTVEIVENPLDFTYIAKSHERYKMGPGAWFLSYLGDE